MQGQRGKGRAATCSSLYPTIKSAHSSSSKALQLGQGGWTGQNRKTKAVLKPVSWRSLRRAELAGWLAKLRVAPIPFPARPSLLRSANLALAYRGTSCTAVALHRHRHRPVETPDRCQMSAWCVNSRVSSDSGRKHRFHVWQHPAAVAITAHNTRLLAADGIPIHPTIDLSILCTSPKIFIDKKRSASG